MAQIEGGGGGDHGKHGKKRAKKLSTRIDMTPMVDLAFLLLTFFVLTSTFSKPKVLQMKFPEKLKKDDKPINVKHGLTIIMSGENRVFYYFDKLDKKTPQDSFKESDFSKDGLRKVLKGGNAKLLAIRTKLQNRLNQLDKGDSLGIKKITDDLDSAVAKDRFVVIVKHDPDAVYSNMIDVVDELLITQVARYFVADDKLTAEEKKYLDAAKKLKKQK